MLNLRVDVSRINGRIKMSCAKHPRYNPENGPGAIVGNCKGCLELWDVYAIYNKAINAIGTLGQMLDDHGTRYTRVTKTKE